MTNEEMERVEIKAHIALRKIGFLAISCGRENWDKFWEKLQACETEKDAESELALFLLK